MGIRVCTHQRPQRNLFKLRPYRARTYSRYGVIGLSYLEDINRGFPTLRKPQEPYPILGAASGLHPYHFTYPERKLTMEEMLYKFIEEGKCEHEEMRAFICDFKTTNEILFKERNNSLIDFRFGAQQKKFLENLKQLYINMLFIEAPAKMSKYAKFLKGLLTNKARLEEACTIAMNERLGEPKATRISLELADRTIQYPRGIIEIVRIKVDIFIILIDFVVLDMPEDSRVPIILGRPFLVTARAMIDVFNKKITLRVRDDEVILDVDQSIKRLPTEDDECPMIDDLDNTINAEAQELLANDEPDLFLSRGLEK
ncbi:DNA-directed DNA polymerase [Tanacetum coccineum]|uniref:DNA-directed DNA polymerase n=1 Tax=Tanacetum coccineum TaxID=301880 RepID=A0ABQ5IYT8_9ASTR